MRITTQPNSNGTQRFFLGAFLLKLVLQSCSINMIAEFDQDSLEMTRLLAKRVDYFYTRLSYQDEIDRSYDKYESIYLDIEVSLNELHLRQESRRLNEFSLTQVNILRNLWKEDRIYHKKNNTLSDFIIKRHSGQFNRVFLAIIQGEQSKPKSKR